VAIKHISKSRVTEWENVEGRSLPTEICLLQKLSHVAGVVQLLDYFEHADSFVLILERPSPCHDLFDYITEHGSLPEHEARGFFRQVVDILVEVHEAGIIHLDVKDENILVEAETGRLRLLDFGSGTYYKDDVYTEFDGEEHFHRRTKAVSGCCSCEALSIESDLGLVLLIELMLLYAIVISVEFTLGSCEHSQWLLTLSNASILCAKCHR